MTSRVLSRRQALDLLKEFCVSESVVEHVLVVADLAKKIAEDVRASGHDVDVGFVESAAIVHDIGRCRSHGIEHGVLGAELLKDYPRYARVCETHIGGGVGETEAAKLGLPEKDFLPETLEEKIIAHADNLVDENKVVSFEEAVREYSKKFGENHPATVKVKKLGEEVEKLRGALE